MIIFRNPGIIDMMAVKTMGVSVKEGDGAIGYFGTGLKFAIATILRNDCSITIYRGEQAFSFTADDIEIRGELFQQVCMNGDPIGFTTMLGRKWEPWMAFRELASNCKDEGGDYFLSNADYIPCDDETTVIVTGEAMQDVWPERYTIMLESQPIQSNDVFEVHDGACPYVYYRGVRIFKSPRPLAFTYNVMEKVDLTEDRTAKTWYQLEVQLERGIGALEDKAMIRRMMTCGEMFQEHHMNVPAYGHPGSAFREVARQLAMGHASEKDANPAAVASARISAIEDMDAGDSITLEPYQAVMLEKAKTMLESDGFKIGDFPIVICETLGPSICGMAHDGKIFLSLIPFEKGTREVAATLLEEYAHLRSGESDCTRGFQNWLFDKILCRVERSAGNPF